jgi:hypothetical protein
MNGSFASKKFHSLSRLTTISFSRRILKHAVSALVSDAFALLRKATIGFVMSVRTCIRPHRTSQFPRNRFSLTLILLMWRIGWAPNSIPIYIQEDATLHSLFLPGNCSTCFGWYFYASSGAHTPISAASGICHTVTAICRYRGRVGTGLSVLWVVYATHSTLKLYTACIGLYCDYIIWVYLALCLF